MKDLLGTLALGGRRDGGNALGGLSSSLIPEPTHQSRPQCQFGPQGPHKAHARGVRKSSRKVDCQVGLEG